jgi:hypothetical protein
LRNSRKLRKATWPFAQRLAQLRKRHGQTAVQEALSEEVSAAHPLHKLRNMKSSKVVTNGQAPETKAVKKLTLERQTIQNLRVRANVRTGRTSVHSSDSASGGTNDCTW